MPERHLREVLRELHEELERSEAIDDETRALLHGARREIEEALGEAPPESARKLASARGRIGGTLERLQGEHPGAAALLQRVLDALTALGI